MSTARPFSYNTGPQISGTIQVGDLAIGYPTTGYTGMEWWNGPDEDLGYVIAQPVPADTQPTPIFGVTASVGFFRTNGFNDNEFVDIANILLGSSYIDPFLASSALTINGFWNSYPTPVLYLDAGDPSSYPGTGTVWTDIVSGRTFNLINGPGYDPSNGGKIYFYAAGGQYAECSSSLPNLSTWSVGVWHYYTGSNTGGAPCIVTELYPGNTGNINYSLGNNTGNLSSGYFNGGWGTSGDYVLTPNNWYYIVGTYDGTILSLYVNNILVATNTYVGNPISSQGGIRLMMRWDLPDFWDGYLSTVGIYDKALTSGQITSIWNSTKSRFGYSGFTIYPTDFVSSYQGYGVSGDNNTFTISGSHGSGEAFYGPIFSQNAGGSTLKADEINNYFITNGLAVNNNSYLFNATWGQEVP